MSDCKCQQKSIDRNCISHICARIGKFYKNILKKLYNKYYVDQLEQEKPHDDDDRHTRE